MQYVNFIFVQDGDEAPALYTAPVPADDAAYVRRIAETLRPLSDEDYMNGPGAILHTMAKYSYVLNGDDLYWLIEWDPGLIVVRFSSNGALAWSAIRSPVPDFGGRVCNDSDWEAYDEEAENPQYNLIFDPWDAQFDAQKREWKRFVPADAAIRSSFEKVLARANDLGEIMEQRYSDAEDVWFERSTENLAKWSGDGVRLH